MAIAFSKLAKKIQMCENAGNFQKNKETDKKCYNVNLTSQTCISMSCIHTILKLKCDAI